MPAGNSWLVALGGIGLFLFGMGLMTEGLRNLAGPSLARWLALSTRSVVSGTVIGAASTAVIQSSTATTVTAIGFVGAGLLSFEQSLGIVYGANIGTSITAWMVAVFGFKLDLGTLAPLLVLAGALLRLTGKARSVALGSALAGFGLLFLGIDVLQDGMAGLEGRVSPDDLPPDTWRGRAELVGIGVLMTIVVQSSSAALTAALAALSSGAITLPQATALMIGMNIGTTTTALVASVRGTVAARRTGFAHFAFNFATGCAAFALLPLFPRLLDLVGPRFASEDPELSLAIFHTAFNVGGAVLFVPLTRGFAELVTRLIREHSTGPARRLDPQLLTQPDIALEAVAATTRELGRAALRHVGLDLRNPGRAARRVEHALALRADTAKARTFLGDVKLQAGDHQRRGAVVELLDTLDHIQRMLVRTEPRLRGAHGVNAARERLDVLLHRRSARLAGPLIAAASALRDQGQGANVRALKAAWEQLAGDAQALREQILHLAANDELAPDEALARMDEVRRVTRVGRHAYRLTYHLERAGRSVSAATPRSVRLGGTGGAEAASV